MEGVCDWTEVISGDALEGFYELYLDLLKAGKHFGLVD